MAATIDNKIRFKNTFAKTRGLKTSVIASSLLMSMGLGWGVQAQANGRLLVGGNGRLPYQTQHERLFAGGDCVRGADLVVTAVQEGRDAAASIARALRGLKAIPAELAAG